MTGKRPREDPGVTLLRCYRSLVAAVFLWEAAAWVGGTPIWPLN